MHSGFNPAIERGEYTMGMSANQLALVQAVAKNDLAAAKKAAIACCAEDTTRKNQHAVNRLKNLLQSGGGELKELPSTISRFASMEDLSSSFNEKRYFLTEDAKKIYNRIQLMHEASLELMARGVPYLNATLLYGESGNGKTMLGRYIAYKLGLPFFYVNFSQVVSSLMGDTAKNLTQVIQYAKQNPCLLMLDELDCISSSRAIRGDGADRELARTTTCLIQMLDSIPNNVVIVGTTNLPDTVDPAVRRRFPQQYEIHRLTAEEAEGMMNAYQADAGFSFDPEAIHTFASERHTTAEIINKLAHSMAEALISGRGNSPECE